MNISFLFINSQNIWNHSLILFKLSMKLIRRDLHRVLQLPHRPRGRQESTAMEVWAGAIAVRPLRLQLQNVEELARLSQMRTTSMPTVMTAFTCSLRRPQLRRQPPKGCPGQICTVEDAVARLVPCSLLPDRPRALLAPKETTTMCDIACFFSSLEIIRLSHNTSLHNQEVGTVEAR